MMAILCKTIRALCMVAVGALGACAATGPAGSVKNGQYTLLQGQSVRLAPQLTLHFDSIDDSRCPTGATCVWAGEIRYHFTLRSAAHEPFVLSERAPAFSSSRLKGLCVALDKPQAPPLPRVGAAPPNYPVTLEVSST